MSFVAVAIGGGALAGLGGSVLSSNAASSAADKQAAASNQANQLQYQMWQQLQNNQDPWRQAGLSALYGGLFKRKDGGTGMADNSADIAAKKNSWINERFNAEVANRQKALGMQLNGPGSNASDYDRKIAGMSDDQIRASLENDWNTDVSKRPENMVKVAADQYEIDPDLTRNFTNEDFVKDPGYDFRMKQGQQALERSAAAKGGLQSGGALKAIAQYGQDYASNEYQNAYNRFNNDRTQRFNRLSSIAGIGQNADAQINQTGQNYANQVGQNMMGTANAQGAAGIASANAWGGALSNLGNLGMQGAWMNNWKSAQSVSPAAATSIPTAGGSYFKTGNIV